MKNSKEINLADTTKINISTKKKSDFINFKVKLDTIGVSMSITSDVTPDEALKIALALTEAANRIKGNTLPEQSVPS